jgi:hypothetical protein
MSNVCGFCSHSSSVQNLRRPSNEGSFSSNPFLSKILLSSRVCSTYTLYPEFFVNSQSVVSLVYLIRLSSCAFPRMKMFLTCSLRRICASFFDSCLRFASSSTAASVVSLGHANVGPCPSSAPERALRRTDRDLWMVHHLASRVVRGLCTRYCGGRCLGERSSFQSSSAGEATQGRLCVCVCHHLRK